MRFPVEKADGKKKRVWIVDTTLRDGEQAPGVAFDTGAKLAIARLLADLGVEEIEAGIPAMGPEACRDLVRLNGLGLPCRLSAWCRAEQSDIEQAAECGLPGVHISFPLSLIQLEAFGKSRRWVLERMEALVPRAAALFPHVSVGAQDATRCETSFLRRFVRLAADCGAGRVRIADTVGIATPAAIRRIIAPLSRCAPGMQIEFHGHNDLGLATANALCALEAGAGALSVTVNGLGERAGNAALEQLAVALPFTENWRSRLDTRRLMALCEYVARASGRPIPADRPVTGVQVFQHESGIHCAALLENPLAYQPFVPETVGRSGFGFVLGRHSGTASIRHILNQAGIAVSRDEALRLKSVLCRQRGKPKAAERVG